MNKLIEKMIAVMLIITLAGANLAVLGMYSITYALSDSELGEQNAATENANVEFNAYLEGGGHTVVIGEDAENTMLYLNLNVQTAGYLKNTIITFEDVNFKIAEKVENEYIQSIDTENNKIILKQINNGSNITIGIPITILDTDSVPSDNFAKESKVVFHGTYVDGSGDEYSVSKEIRNKISWNRQAEASIKAEVVKYIPYAEGEKFGVMVQVKLNSEVKDSKLPVKESNITVVAPEINGIKPSSSYVSANKTMSTNGKANGIEFENDQYQYDAENGIVTIQTKNQEDANGKINWKKDAQDEYLVTFMFDSKEAYDFVQEEGINSKVVVSGSMVLYNSEDTTVDVPAIEKNIEMKTSLGNMLDFSVQATKELAKGNIYASYDAKEDKKEETNYNVEYSAIVNNLELTDYIEFDQGIDTFVRKDGQEGLTTIEDKNYTYNKAVKISEKVFKKILGNDGYIEILNKEGTVIAQINKESNKDKNGNYVVDVSEFNNNELTIKTSKPVTVGKITIEVEKAISNTLDYSKAQMKDFVKLKTKVTGKAMSSTISEEKEIELKEVKSVAQVEISKKDLSTAVKNEKVELRAILDTSNIGYALYKNPTLKITLPKSISRIGLNNAKILMSNGLKIDKVDAKTENGAPVIYVTLKGTQSEYAINAEYKGTILIIESDIIVKSLTPNSTEKIVMEFTNENEVSTNKSGKVETEVNFVAPAGVVAANGIANYAEKSNAVLSISDESTNVVIPTYAEKKIATISGKVINNYGNDITDVVILGRFPSKDNVKIDSADDLGSTFDATLNSAIALSGIPAENYTIYYSDRADATKELSDENNKWTTNATNSAKSYLIVTKDFKMENGKAIDFSYNIEIPKNLSYNNSVSEMYKVYYNNVSNIGTIAETKVSPIIEASTGEGPDLSISLTSASNIVRDGQIVRIKATIKNNGELPAENAKLHITAPTGTVHTEIKERTRSYSDSKEAEKVIDLGTIKSGETVVKEYELRLKIAEYEHEQEKQSLDNLVENQESQWEDKQLENTIRITADNINNEIKSEPYVLTVKEADLQITNIPETHESTVLRKGDKLEYKVKVENVSKTKDLENVKLNIEFPTGIKVDKIYYTKAGSSEKYEESSIINGNIATVDIGKLESVVKNRSTSAQNEESENGEGLQITPSTACSNATVFLECSVEDFYGEYNLIMNATADNAETHYSNVQKIKAGEMKLTLVQADPNQTYVKENTQFTNHFTVKNVGEEESIVNKMEIQVPEGLSLVKAEYEQNGEKETTTYVNSDRIATLEIYKLAVGETIDIVVTFKADLLPDENDKEITMFATLSASGFDKIESNKEKVIIEYNPEEHKYNSPSSPNNPSTPDLPAYRIEGTAWLDGDKNGKRDEGEEILSNIPVVLVYKKDNSVVKNSKTNQEQRTQTGSDGTYKFDNVVAGEYLVLFLYDVTNYSLTTYQADGIAETLNSDAIDINLTFDGERRVAGITDIITVKDSNIRDIDIGLYVSQKFDLKLDKYVSKITRTTPTSGTNTFNYTKETGKVTKIEVLPSNVGQSNVVIEYKIVVTNVSPVSGYAKKIVDYLPEHVNFNTELNTDWYLSENGNIYNSSLENEKINPGESKELTLVLTAKFTEENLDNLNNNAEIYESFNEEGLRDINSDNDKSNADVILSLVTGKTVEYVALAFGVIVLLGFGIFEINRRVLAKKKD